MTEAKEKKIAQLMSFEVAENDFIRWAEDWRIDDDVETMSADDVEDFTKLKRIIVKSIQKGYLVVSEDGSELKHILRDKSDLTYKMPEGSGWLTMDNHKRENAKMFGYLGDMTGRPAKFFSNLSGVDIKIAAAVVQLFLG